MKTFYCLLDRLLGVLLATIFIIMVSTVAGNVFCRFVLGQSLSWGEEVAQILLTYLTFLGATLAMRDNEHYSFDYLVSRLPNRANRIILYLRWTLILLMSVLLFYWSAQATWLIRDWIMPSTEINRALVYGVAPTSMIFMIAYSLRSIRNLNSNTAEISEASAKEESQ